MSSEGEVQDSNIDDILEQIMISEEVQKAIDEVLPSKDPLDQADFNAVNYINTLFPTEQSLSNIDDVIAKLEMEIYSIDGNIRSAIRGQADISQDGQAALEEARLVIKQLLAHADKIRNQAEESEETVHEITRDIKQLDTAKKNLTTAITTLNHLQMLVAGVESLQLYTKKRQYSGVIFPLECVTEVMEHFKSYLDVPQVAELSKQVQDIRFQLAQQITTDFREAFSESNSKVAVPCGQLADACKVVSVLDPDVKNDLLKWFQTLQLKEYVYLFQETQDCAWLDKIDKRYAWIKKHLLDFEEKFGAMFPPEWEVSERITVEFCKITRTELRKLMEKNSKKLDVKLLLYAIQKTDNFENLLGRRFSGVTIRSDVSIINSQSTNPFEEQEEPQSTNPFEENEQGKPIVNLNPFHGIIGQCFEPHLYIYVESLDRNLADLMERFVSDSKQQLCNTDITETEASVLPSCADLFVFYKKCLVQCSQLSTSTTMLNLAHTFQKYLREYAQNVLTNNLPKVSGTTSSLASSVSTLSRGELAAGLMQNIQKLTKEGETTRLNISEQKRVCCLLITAEYCMETAQQLELKLKEKIDTKLSDKINLSQEQEIFVNVMSNCLQILVQDLETACDSPLTAMTKMNWQNVESVGDQSPYVTAVINHLKTTVPVIRDQLASSRKYFTQFCGKFANVFIQKFVSALYKCRSINTVGAEQLLLDTHSLKTVLLEMPSIGSQINRKAPSSYTKVVIKGMEKAEMILKVVMTPVEPKTVFVKQVVHLLSDIDQSEFVKLLDLKGIRRSEQQSILELHKEARPELHTSHTTPDHEASRIKKLERIMKSKEYRIKR